jgi:hypothetical protein
MRNLALRLNSRSPGCQASWTANQRASCELPIATPVTSPFSLRHKASAAAPLAPQSADWGNTIAE